MSFQNAIALTYLTESLLKWTAEHKRATITKALISKSTVLLPI